MSAAAWYLIDQSADAGGGERAVLGADLEDPEGRIVGGVVRSIFVNREREVVTV
jgi:hypothetical protein